MRLLVIGGGGREHALAWRLAKSEDVSKVFVAPGNAGTAREPLLENISLTDLQELADFAAREQIHATIVGPEAPLAAGVVDLFRERGLRIFGPTKAAAQLESSKDFAKRFMTRHGIPTAAFQTFSDIAAAHAYVNQVGAPIVIKADGLAAGKGVVVAMSLAEAHAAIDAMLADNKLGDAGARVVVEEFLDGEEASFIVMVDGKTALAMATRSRVSFTSSCGLATRYIWVLPTPPTGMRSREGRMLDLNSDGLAVSTEVGAIRKV